MSTQAMERETFGCPLCISNEKNEEIAALAERGRKMLAALKAASGFLMNAKIDLETGAPKRTAIMTLDGGLKIIGAAIDKFGGEKSS